MDQSIVSNHAFIDHVFPLYCNVLYRSPTLECILFSPSSYMCTQRIPRSSLKTLVSLWNTGSESDERVPLPKATERLELAADFVENAINERPCEPIRSGPLPRHIRRLTNSFTYRCLILSTIAIHLCLAFLESPSFTAASEPMFVSRHKITRSIELICCLIYLFDIGKPDVKARQLLYSLPF